MINYTFVNWRNSQLGMFWGAKKGRDFLAEINLFLYLLFPCISFVLLLLCDSQHSEVLCTLTVPLWQNRFLTEKPLSVHLLFVNSLSLQALQRAC